MKLPFYANLRHTSIVPYLFAKLPFISLSNSVAYSFRTIFKSVHKRSATISFHTMPNKRLLDENECLQLIRLCSEVHLQCRTCIAILQTNQTSSFVLWNSSNEAVLTSLQKLHSLLNSDFTNTLQIIYEFVGNYDFQEVRANGLRSFLMLITRCLASILTYLRGVTSASMWSRSKGNILVAYINCFGELHTCVNVLKEMPRFCPPGSLFPRNDLVGLPEIGFVPSVAVEAEAENFSQPNANQGVASDELVEFQNLQTRSDHIKQEYFYGHCVAFYFCPTAQRMLLLLTSLMAGYGSSYLASKQGLSNLVHTVFRSVTSYLSPEDRGAMVAKLTRDSTVEFCKRFWSFAENRLVASGPNVILPSMAVAHAFELAPTPLYLPSTVKHNTSSSESAGDICPPRSPDLIRIPYPAAHFGPAPLAVRLLSYRLRPGMEWAQPNFFSSIFQSARKPSRTSDISIESDEQSGGLSRNATDSVFELGWKSSSSGSMSYSTPHKPSTSVPLSPKSPKTNATNNLSPYLLFHIHGGGFVALNSQAQDIFLRSWAEFLDCPIFSVNYSLAPQAPYPRALEECFFAYCWAALNREKLGAAPDARIVLCGDSAGGNLVLGLCLRIAQAGIIPRPTGALIAYAPILISFCPTPARMLSLADPLLPIGILSKCLLAYAGVDESRLCPASSMAPKVNGFAPHHQRQHSMFSDLLWNRLVPTFWNSANVSEGEELKDARSDQLSFNHKLSNTHRDSLSLPAGLSDLIKASDKAGSAQSSPHNSHASTPTNGGASIGPKSQLVSKPHFDLAEMDSENMESATGHSTMFPKAPELHSTGRPVRAPKSDLDRVREIQFPQDCFMSPFLASDHLFSQLPPLGIACSTFDPFLDDCLELAKRASRLNVPIDLQVFEDLPHAFLNFAPLGPEFQRANQICMKMVKRLFERSSPTVPSTADTESFKSFDEAQHS